MTDTLIATYRLQFRPEFTLDQAAGEVDYLQRLGISHLYASPFLQSTPGSTHGYDVVDYTRVNEELGGQPALDRLSERLRGAGMGLVLDMVPNHMAIHPQNPWWWDVLKNGPASRYASYFDVDWDPPEARHSNEVLLPVLGDHYGRVLEAGEVKVAYEDGTFTVHYYDNVFPVDPCSLGMILSAAVEHYPDNELAFIAGAVDRLPGPDQTDRASRRRRYRDTEVLRAMLDQLVRERPAVGEAIQEALDAVNASPDALDAFLTRQNYRLALWKISARELGYRRFFDINNLIGLRMEGEDTYQDTHELVIQLLKQGVLDGLRIDHPDGLIDPQGYFDRLRADAPDAWIVIEKILEPGEHLPASWPVQGTSGYDFLNRANDLLVDPTGEKPLTDFYARFTGRAVDYPALVHEKKLLAARQVLGSDLSRLTELLIQVCERHREHRDYTRTELIAALAETAANLPIYRTYVRPDEGDLSQMDVVHVNAAVEGGKASRPDLDPRLFDFLRDLLLCRLEPWGKVETELVKRFQQFTGPVMAKGLEDTVFYVFNRLISLNEVGGDPGHFGLSPAEFHKACQETQSRWPLSMLSTSTHDTKRSEDVRARLDVLSEMHGEWTDAVLRWAEMNEKHRQEIPAGQARAANGNEAADNKWPDRNTEYLLYQTLVGAWPISADRAVEYMRKAGREAKEYTSWTAPNEAYEEAVENFTRAILKDSRFTADLETFVAEILDPGRVNSLAQTLLKLTTPGVPDLYQGTEVWNLSLVDPDNRRPVDYERRARLLERLENNPSPEMILKHVEEGLPKLWVIRQALALRHAHPEWFGVHGSYTPLEVRGEDALRVEEGKSPAEVERALRAVEGKSPAEVERSPEGVLEEAEPLVAVTGAEMVSAGDPALAFLRGGNVLVAVPRLMTRYREDWNRYTVDVPEGRWRSWLTGEEFGGGPTDLERLFARFPVALLAREEEQA